MTVALAVAPVLLRVTLAPALALTRSTTSKWSDGSLMSTVNSEPYVLDWSSALIVSALVDGQLAVLVGDLVVAEAGAQRAADDDRVRAAGDAGAGRCAGAAEGHAGDRVGVDQADDVEVERRVGGVEREPRPYVLDWSVALIVSTLGSIVSSAFS